MFIACLVPFQFQFLPTKNTTGSTRHRKRKIASKMQNATMSPLPTVEYLTLWGPLFPIGKMRLPVDQKTARIAGARSRRWYFSTQTESKKGRDFLFLTTANIIGQGRRDDISPPNSRIREKLPGDLFWSSSCGETINMRHNLHVKQSSLYHMIWCHVEEWPPSVSTRVSSPRRRFI